MSNPGPGYAKHPEHKVTVTTETACVRVLFDGEVIADTTSTLRLQEAGYPPVHYVPRKDVKMERLEKTTRLTHCPFKGDCSYFTIAGARREENAVWSYEAPFDEVLAIEEHLAFYPDKVSIEVG